MERDVIGWSTVDVAGINFGDSHITAARVRKTVGGAREVTHAGWGEYDSSAPEPKVAEALRALWRKTGLPTTTVVASLRSASLVVRYFKYPGMPQDELRSALRLQAEESLQMTGDQLVVDCHLNVGSGSAAGQGGGAPIEGVMAAAPLKDVQRMLNILFLAGLDPIILDVRSMAVANLYVALARTGDDSPVCVVNLAPHSADLIVLSRTGAIYPHTVFCRSSTWRESPAFLCENIRDAIRYSEFKLDWPQVERIVLTGDMPANGEFVAKIRQGVDKPVEIWNPLSGLTLKAGGVRELLTSNPVNAAMLAPCLGLALRRG